MSTRPISLEADSPPPVVQVPSSREEQDIRIQAAVQRRPEVEEPPSKRLRVGADRPVNWPIGIQSIQLLLESGCAYVDKTGLIAKLIAGFRYSLSRPRRFGKSLVTDIIENIFKGNKELFKGLAIYDADYDWAPHPVIRLDFSNIAHHTPEELKASLLAKLYGIAGENGIALKSSILEVALTDLVHELFKKTGQRVVVLVDEYDKPIIDFIDDLSIADQNRSTLKEFFTTLKSLDADLRFVFITGVSSFSRVSLFSGMNNLEDITRSPEYATLCGYTEEEVLSYFKTPIANVAEKHEISSEAVIQLMRQWYNGYRFSQEGERVYNPISVMLFLKRGEIGGYWFETGTPTFLIKLIKQKLSVDELADIHVGETFFSSYELEKMDPLCLMWQTGYLTITAYNPSSRIYTLDYPNKEVEEAFTYYLAKAFTGLETALVTGYSQACVQALHSCDLERFFHQLKTLFANIPYDMHISQEKYYQSIFFVMAKLIGLDADLEVKTTRGRIDMTIKTKNYVYIFEFKINSTAVAAFDQIEDRRYFEKYACEGKKIVLVGANFSMTEKNLTDWKSKILDVSPA